MGIAAGIVAGAEALKALCEFLATPQGQGVVEDWRKDAAAWNAAIKRAGDWFEGLVKLK